MKHLTLPVAICWLALSAAAAAQPAELASQAASPTFDVELLDGQSLKAVTLKSLGQNAIEIDRDGTASSIPLRELELMRKSEPAPEPDAPSAVEATLQNGSLLKGNSVRVTKRIVEFVSPLDALSFPVAEVRSLRLAATDEKLEAAWTEISRRDTRNDLLVVRKGDALDFVAGVVGDVTEKEVKLLVREREVPVPRERVYGVVYVLQPSATPAVCEVALASGDRLKLSDLSLAGDQLVATISGQAKVTLPLTQVASLDFTLGKVKSLTDLPMTQTQFAKSPLLTAAAFEVRKNHNSLGDVLRIGDREFPRGLWMHSGSSAVFRLGREYRRLTATIGLDSNSTELPRIAPHVKLVILGDGKQLDSHEVAWDDAAKAIDIDVSAVRELELRVESPRETPGVLEHLVLGEARVIQ